MSTELPAWSAQSGFDVRLGWGPIGLQALRDEVSTLVIVDILRFTTALDVAVSTGASVAPAKWPYRPARSAAGAAGVAGAAAAEGAGGDEGTEVADGTGQRGLSLSPPTLAALGPGDRIVLPSPNGSHCCAEAAARGATVVGACLRNAQAVAHWLLGTAGGGPVAVVPCGERWPEGSLRPAVEDLIGAGAIVAGLEASGWAPSPEARAASAAFRSARADLHGFLAASSSGRELSGQGHRDDVDWAAALNVSPCVPVLGPRGAFENLAPTPEPGSSPSVH